MIPKRRPERPERPARPAPDPSPNSGRRRRQWGADRPRAPLPPVAAPATDTQITLGRLGIVFTLLAWAGYLLVTVLSQFVNRGFQGMRFTSETVGYVVIMSFLTFSSLMYLVARQGALYRSRAHRRVPRAVIDDWFDTSLPTMSALVPSYREQIPTIRKTLLSAALQEYPYLRIVLLLDDPPNPANGEHADALGQARAIASELTHWLAEPCERFGASLEDFEIATLADGDPLPEQVLELVAHYEWAATWLRDRAADEERNDHVDVFFADRVLGGLAADFDSVALALTESVQADAYLPRRRMLQLHRRLAWTFRAEITWFERKLYDSLSHDSNKAMNLNSYLGLMGRSFDPRPGTDGSGLVLQPAGSSGAIVIPDADYVLTLDADSVLLPEYCLRLVYVLDQPENQRLAVAQTPYSAFPGSTTRIERLAGATTDLQHIVHQGMSYQDAAFWVGANAVIRKCALDEIVEVEQVDGYEIRRYVQDRTVIEDTESSLDLAIHGWRLLNYPERLSYSATPPDFGALSIQRRRWANGGLLIIAKLARNSRERAARGERGGILPACLRINYLASTCWSSVGLVCLLVYPFDSKLLSPLILLAALPYFFAMAGDLHRCGYKRTDVLRIYGFNLILLPVNLAGVLKSIEQAITGKKIPFARTPKVRDRTATAPMFTLSPLLIIAFSVYSAWRDVHDGNWGNAVFASLNTLAVSYAVVAFIGIRALIVDTWLGLIEHLYVSDKAQRPTRRRAHAGRIVVSPAWSDILYRGAAATGTGAHLTESAGSFRISANGPAPRPLSRPPIPARDGLAEQAG
jgi:cellulose synthase (UDP-forming)